jgi:hypothetical protein
MGWTEACVGAHHLSRELLALGHDVKLVTGQFVFSRARAAIRLSSPLEGRGKGVGSTITPKTLLLRLLASRSRVLVKMGLW